MKYGRVFRTTLREVGALDVLIYGPALHHGVVNKDWNILKAIGSQNYIEDRLGFGTGAARKAGRKLGSAMRRARGLESTVTRASLMEQSDENFINPAFTNVQNLQGKIRGSKTYQDLGELPLVGEKAQRTLERKRAGRAVTTANQQQLAHMRTQHEQKIKDVDLHNRAAKEIPELGLKEKPVPVPMEQHAGIKRLEKRIKGGPGVENQGKRFQRIMARKNDPARLELLRKKIAAGRTPVATPTWGSKFGSFGKGALALGTVTAYQTAKTVGAAAEEVAKTASGGYADLQRGIRMQSAGAKPGKLRENKQTWVTRKAKYGPSGRKRKTWKFDFNKPSHVKHALALDSDTDIKKLMRSNADITKHVGLKTKSGIPINFAYRSNNRKNLYAGKTIGMRQHTLSQHRKLGLPLPRGFQNWHFERVNNLFKKHQGEDWYNKQYAQAPIHRKLMIGVGSMWKKARKMLGMESEPAISEVANVVESSQEYADEPVACTFMEGIVPTPTECDCPDCLAVTRRIRESQKVKETAETSFGQMLRGGTQPLAATAKTPKKLSRKLMIQTARKWKKPVTAGGSYVNPSP